MFEQYRPTAVMHLAAESHVDRSIDGPADFIRTNITGTFTLLEAALRHWKNGDAEAHATRFRFLHVSTDEVFGSLGATGFFTEETPYAPNSPYSASKAASDHLVRAWHHTYGLPTVMTNCSNNYGPYQFPEKLDPAGDPQRAGRQAPADLRQGGQHPRLAVRGRPRPRPPRGAGDGASWASRTTSAATTRRRTWRSSTRSARCWTSFAPMRRIGPHASLITFVKDRPGHDSATPSTPPGSAASWAGRRARTSTSGLRKTVEWYLANPPGRRRHVPGRAPRPGPRGGLELTSLPLADARFEILRSRNLDDLHPESRIWNP